MRGMKAEAAAVSRFVVVATANEELRTRVEECLRERGVDIEFVAGGAGALSRLEEETCWGLLLDRALPDLDVEEVKGIINGRFPQVKTWIIRFESGRVCLEACPESVPLPPELSPLREGSYDRDSAGQRWLKVPIESFPDLAEFSEPELLPGIIGRSKAISRLQALVHLVAPRKTAVLLTGETGTGKELVAKAIHQLGPRRKQPFVVVNCAAIPESLFESELFGHRRGAFTGAVESRLGRIQAAPTGTLFFDEVGELPPGMQAKLLRFLQEGEVQRLGSHELLRVNARVIAATNADLEDLVSKGRFREDLFYRLAVFPIELEPLRERPDDIALLAQHFLREFSAQAGERPKALSPSAIHVLKAHCWPGNVRELQHATERAWILAGGHPWFSQSISA
jgi:DNA-binding NtrC family response regulator